MRRHSEQAAQKLIAKAEDLAVLCNLTAPNFHLFIERVLYETGDVEFKPEVLSIEPKTTESVCLKLVF